MKRIASSALVFLAGLPTPALATKGDRAGDAGVSALWVLANFCYAGMRAQSHPSAFWRIISFICGFPGTLLSWFLVKEGSESAYGVDLPKK